MFVSRRPTHYPLTARWAVGLAFAVLALTLLAPSLGAAAGAAIDPDQALDGFDAWVEEIMKEWKVPGLGVAILHDNKLLVARGYGYRDLANQAPADGDTLFAIGSNSKSFTATILAMLEDDNQLDWDQPIRDFIPEFQLHDPVASAQMNAIDLLSHRSGLPRHDLVWYASDLSRSELLNRLRYLEPTEQLRAKFQYQNLMFMTAGILAEEITGKSWEALVRERILTPLGMQRSNFSVDDMQRDDNFAYPHFHVEDSEIERVPFRNIDAVGPAGSINSSAREMAKYVEFHLNGGAAGAGDDAARLLSTTNAARLQAPQMVIEGPLAARASGNERGTPAYGLGLMVSTYRGHKHVFHGGGIDGFISAMEWMPDDGIGVVVLSNTSGSGDVPRLVALNVFDRLLGLEPVDWAGRAREQRAEALEAAENADSEAQTARHEGTSPSHPLEAFAGTYGHPGYGETTVTLTDDGLHMSVAGLEGPLDHYHYDVFEVPKSEEPQVANLAGTKVQFLYSKDGAVDRVTVPLEAALPDIVFKRVASKELSDPGFLARLTGDYVLGPMTVTVEVNGDQLSVDVPGQQVYKLVPASGLTFDFEGLDGFRAEFVIDASDPSSRATAMIAHQPNGSLRAERKAN